MAQLKQAISATPRAYAHSLPAIPASEVDWPPYALQAFKVRMADHGVYVSSTMMLGERRYALEQLCQAHATADDELRALAMGLFRYFERQRTGLQYAN
ncbi:hypothetical protein [uncultured Ramlibacter sp.]|uniref:hypothetical protein n=1 Tax=uncultured Ramlibacter sp. TaxID=260755 RepID=UPI002624D192|nr:hypothetical protein [uncultured Ramlibacter sp.]